MDKKYIKGVIQKIVNKEFSDIERKEIIEYSDRLNFCAPCCGDSHKNKHAKRGNLYFRNLYYICFNCGHKSSFNNFVKKFNEQIDPQKKLEIIEHLNSQVTYSEVEEDIIDAQLDQLLNLEDVTRIFNSGDYPINDFEPVVVGSPVYKYLVGRAISPIFHKNIYQAKYWYNSDRWEPIICLLNRKGDKLLSVQIRNLKSGRWRMFRIYNYETLYKWIHDIDDNKDIEDIDLNQVIMYDKVGAFFNILGVDFEKRITIFEGYLDSLFFPNSIGVVGTNTDLGFLENNNLDLQYMFDNDDAGYRKAEEKIKAGYPVFLWNKLFEDIVKKKNTQDPYGLMYRISKVKDLNQLAQLVKDPYKTLNLSEYFSKDIYDIKWLPKQAKRTYKKRN